MIARQNQIRSNILKAFLIFAVTVTIASYYSQKQRDTLQTQVQVNAAKTTAIVKTASVAAKTAAISREKADAVAKLAAEDCAAQKIRARAISHYYRNVDEQLNSQIHNPTHNEKLIVKILTDTGHAYLTEMRPITPLVCATPRV